MANDLTKFGRQSSGWLCLLTGCGLILGSVLLALVGLIGAVMALFAGNWSSHMGVWFHLLPTILIGGALLFIGVVLYRFGLRLTNDTDSDNQAPRDTSDAT